MIYNKTVWVDNQTPLDAEHMNKIEDAIEELASLSSSSGGNNNSDAGVSQDIINRLEAVEAQTTMLSSTLDSINGEVL